MDKEEVVVEDTICMDAEDCIKVSEGLHLDSEIGDFCEMEGENYALVDPGKVVDDVVCPRVGMVFETMKEAYDYYNEYARRSGFSVRKRRTNKKRGDSSKVVLQTLCCSCEGYYTMVSTPIKRREDRQFGCLAVFQIKLSEEGKYVLAKFVAEHTHDLDPPSMERWTKSAKRENVFNSYGEAVPSDIDPSYAARYNELFELAQRILAKAVRSEALYLFVKSELLKIKAELEALPTLEENVDDC